MNNLCQRKQDNDAEQCDDVEDKTMLFKKTKESEMLNWG